MGCNCIWFETNRNRYRESRKKSFSPIANIFSNEEADYINAGSERDYVARYIKVWTLKESYIKYIGMGLFYALNSFEVNLEKKVIIEKDNKMVKGIHLNSIEFDNEYFIALCAEENEYITNVVNQKEIYEMLELIK